MPNNNDTDDSTSNLPDKLLEHIETPKETSIAPNEMTELLLNEYDNTHENTIWIVEHPFSTYYTNQITSEDTRMNAVEHALRLAKEESERTGEAIQASIAHERDLLIGSEHVYDYIKCGAKRWRVVQGTPRDDESFRYRDLSADNREERTQ